MAQFPIGRFEFVFDSFLDDKFSVKEGCVYDQTSDEFIQALSTAKFLCPYVIEIEDHILWQEGAFAPYIENLLGTIQETHPKEYGFLCDLAAFYAKQVPAYTVSEQETLRLRQLPYQEYLKTDHWDFMRKKVLARANYRCQLCNARAKETLLHVHHRNYEELGRAAEFYDLIALCASCHSKFHNITENHDE